MNVAIGNHIGRRARPRSGGCTPLLLAALALGCSAYGHAKKNDEHTAAKQEIVDHYNTGMRSAHADLLEEHWWAECTPKASADRCGLVFDEVHGDPYLRKFITKVCGADPATAASLPSDCGERFQRMFTARLVERYSLVDLDTFQLHCDAHPEQCVDQREVELWMLDQHNGIATKRYLERAEQARKQNAEDSDKQSQKEEAERKAKAQVFAQALLRLSNWLTADVVCTTTPDAAGATTTYCKAK